MGQVILVNYCRYCFPPGPSLALNLSVLHILAKALLIHHLGHLPSAVTGHLQEARVSGGRYRGFAGDMLCLRCAGLHLETHIWKFPTENLAGYGDRHLLKALCPRQAYHGRGRGLLLFTPHSFQQLPWSPAGVPHYPPPPPPPPGFDRTAPTADIYSSAVCCAKCTACLGDMLIKPPCHYISRFPAETSLLLGVAGTQTQSP